MYKASIVLIIITEKITLLVSNITIMRFGSSKYDFTLNLRWVNYYRCYQIEQQRYLWCKDDFEYRDLTKHLGATYFTNCANIAFNLIVLDLFKLNDYVSANSIYWKAEIRRVKSYHDSNYCNNQTETLKYFLFLSIRWQNRRQIFWNSRTLCFTDYEHSCISWTGRKL